MEMKHCIFTQQFSILALATAKAIRIDRNLLISSGNLALWPRMSDVIIHSIETEIRLLNINTSASLKTWAGISVVNRLGSEYLGNGIEKTITAAGAYDWILQDNSSFDQNLSMDILYSYQFLPSGTGTANEYKLFKDQIFSHMSDIPLFKLAPAEPLGMIFYFANQTGADLGAKVFYVQLKLGYTEKN